MGARGCVLGLDFGSRRIGLAVSDPRACSHFRPGRSSGPSLARDLLALGALIAERGVTRIVVGLPLHLSGRSGPEAEAARAFARALGEATALPVELLDERWTSREAERSLRDAPGRRKRSRGSVDSVRDPAAAHLARARTRGRRGVSDEARGADALGLALALLGAAGGAAGVHWALSPRTPGRRRGGLHGRAGRVARRDRAHARARGAGAQRERGRVDRAPARAERRAALGRVRALGGAVAERRSSRTSRAAARQLPGRAARGLHRRADRRAARGGRTRRRGRLRHGGPRSRADRVARHLGPEPRGLSLPRDLPAPARARRRDEIARMLAEQFLAVWREIEPLADGAGSRRSTRS